MAILLAAIGQARAQNVRSGDTNVSPAAEAWLFIPEEWRGRVRPLASIPLFEGCAIHPTIGLFGQLGASPAGAAPEVFVLSCAPDRPAFDAINAGDHPTMRWLSADTLEVLAVMRHAQSWAGDVVIRRGAS